MNYRLAHEEDLPAVQKLIDSSDLEKFHATELDGMIMVAELRGELIGCFWAMVCGRHALLDYLIVRPDWQHSGIGLKLIAHLFRELNGRGIRYLRGVVHADNKTMHRVYELFQADLAPNYTYVTGDLHGKEDS